MTITGMPISNQKLRKSKYFICMWIFDVPYFAEIELPSDCVYVSDQSTLIVSENAKSALRAQLKRHRLGMVRNAVEFYKDKLESLFIKPK